MTLVENSAKTKSRNLSYDSELFFYFFNSHFMLSKNLLYRGVSVQGVQGNRGIFLPQVAHILVMEKI